MNKVHCLILVRSSAVDLCSKRWISFSEPLDLFFRTAGSIGLKYTFLPQTSRNVPAVRPRTYCIRSFLWLSTLRILVLGTPAYWQTSIKVLITRVRHFAIITNSHELVFSPDDTVNCTCTEFTVLGKSPVYTIW